ncbi:MAG: hypothetical protein PHU70_02035 [Dehalococcoidia bacterium]|nr:hypothetical protein [Dehalococcoidia bacterium]
MFDWLKNLIFCKPPLQPPYELPSPKVRITGNSVEFTGDEQSSMYLKVSGFKTGSFICGVAPSNSMEPYVDDGMLVLLEPVEYADLVVGDVINYAVLEPLPYPNQNFKGGFHRIINIGTDENGWYCETKGDNPICAKDPCRIRPAMISGVLRAILI